MSHSLTFINQDLPFIQHNDNDRMTHFQCPNCYSYKNEQKTIWSSDKINMINRICLDCGYSTNYKAYGMEEK
ncbi:hypothetical protein [Staphylococcus sp. LKG3-3]|uniref:hypothetical protein n=1 Tax=Staphylococcus sp. LKG3-3 TaxID=3399685 RepID=UPI003D570371